MGYASHFYMFIKRKKNRSGTTSIVVAEKNSGIYKELITIGIARSPEEVSTLTAKAREWIDREQERRHPGDKREREAPVPILIDPLEDI